ncbi:ArdC-like ssDNA-binding domain-containing protein [Listeria monocytogenes]|uniref:ArdC-like ssDNA-binding domain-containing protein n=1 Tax=Listeria monocytogenes TaxID=1639 RepID=UPI0012FC42B3|nr:ArdC-like ssDNA-binding domain-containing protein [Listeria monocytogenes]
MNEETRKKKKRPSLTTLYEGTMKEITSNENRYIEFLNFASRVHKYSFDEQLLLYAQKQDVHMVATFDIWKKLGRFVKRGSTAALLFDYTTQQESMSLIYPKQAENPFRYLIGSYLIMTKMIYFDIGTHMKNRVVRLSIGKMAFTQK